MSTIQQSLGTLEYRHHSLPSFKLSCATSLNLSSEQASTFPFDENFYNLDYVRSSTVHVATGTRLQLVLTFNIRNLGSSFATQLRNLLHYAIQHYKVRFFWSMKR